MALANEALLAVLDGPDPGKWEPWGSNFKELSKQAETADLNLGDQYKHLEDYRLRLLLESREELFRRKNWTRIVGAVVDGRIVAELPAVKKDFVQICANLHLLADAWFRRFGFYVVVVLPSVSTSEQNNFWNELKLTATNFFGERVEVQPVAEEAGFRFVLPAFNRNLIFAVVKEQRSAK